MQLSKPKLSVDFVKNFDEKIYDTVINLNDVDIKTFIIEEERDDVKVIFEGFKEIISNVDFDIIDGVLHIKVNSISSGGVSAGVKIHSVFTMENKLSIYLPIHFINYKVLGDNANIRINNLQTDFLETKSKNGSIKVKYCEIAKDFRIDSENGVISLKSLDVGNDIVINNENGVTKVKTVTVDGNVIIESNNGMITAKDVKSKGVITLSTNNGHLDLDDVYGNTVNINANTGIVEYFNGNFTKKFQVNFNVKNGVIKTNVNRDEIH